MHLKRIILIGLLILGLCGILDTLILLSFRVGINLGVLFPGLLGLFLVILSVSYLYFGFDILRLKSLLIRRILICILIIWFGSFAVVEFLIVNAQWSDFPKKTEVLIVLGAGLKGQQMSLSLATRMYKALEYLNQNPDVKVIVSGGKGIGEDITEAEAMKRFLLSRGIEDYRILKEEKSTSTMENLQFSKELYFKITGKELEEAIVVTNDFHMFRVKILAKRAGLTVYGLPCKSPYSVMINNYIREYFAVLKSLVVDK